MPHRCVRCGTMYEDGAKEILKGCSCGARLFFFVKKKDIDKSDEMIENLTDKDKSQIENDVYDIIGVEKKNDDAPVVLDLESIKILKPGKFELDLVNLFNKDQPLVYKLEEGKYVIDIAESFVREKEAKEEKK
jgi:uncharacterized protein